MTEYEILGTVLSLGVGGVLSIIIFFMYRSDRKSTEDRWEKLAFELVKCRKDESRTRRKHTEALTELTNQLKRMNGKQL